MVEENGARVTLGGGMFIWRGHCKVPPSTPSTSRCPAWVCRGMVEVECPALGGGGTTVFTCEAYPSPANPVVGLGNAAGCGAGGTSESSFIVRVGCGLSVPVMTAGA